MDHVQRRHMIELLAQNEEDRVGELCEFGDEVPPRHRRHPQRLAGWTAVDGLAPKWVIAPPAAHEELVHQPCAEHHLQEVVNDDHAAQLERLAILHKFWSQELHEIGECEADDDCREWRWHQRPVGYTLVGVGFEEVVESR